MIPKPGDVVDLPEGRRLLVITPEHAVSVCKDVQLWRLEGTVWRKDASLQVFRICEWHTLDFTARTPAIEVDPVKGEYECQQ